MRRALTISLALAAGVSACSGKGKVREPAELVEIESPALAVSQTWARNTGDGADGQWTGLTVVPAVDAVFTADVNGTVSAWSPETGEAIWSVETGARVISGPSLSGASLLFGTRDAEVISLSRADGSEQWRSTVTAEVLAPPVSDGTTVVARSGDGRVYGLSAVSGERRWAFDRGVPTLTLRGLSAPVLFSGAAIIGHDNGRVTALRLDQGTPVWEQVVALPTGRSELDRITDIDAPPVIIGENLITVSYGGELVSLNLRDGDINWRRSIRSYTGAVEYGGRVFVTDDDGLVWSLDLSAGAAVWKSEALKYRRLSAPVLHQGRVLVSDFKGYLHWLDPESGEIVARARAGSDRLIDAPVVDGDRVYALSMNGKLRVLEPSAR